MASLCVPRKEAEESIAGGQVRVDVIPGHPIFLGGKLEFADDVQRMLLLSRYRPSLETTRVGASDLLRLRNELSSLPDAQQMLFVTEAELQSIQKWVAFLLGCLQTSDPLKSVLSFEEDILGVYKYDAKNKSADDHFVNQAEIRIYWGMIGLVADWLPCKVEDLAIVVLTHELTHAYTQLGADIEGRRWPAHQFAQTEVALKEGIAQYYTHQVLKRLEMRYAGALKVFQDLLPRQHEIYRIHEHWVKNHSPEAVRRALIEVRRWKEAKLEQFERRLGDAQEQLNPKKANE